jgi:hypothetical protein
MAKKTSSVSAPVSGSTTPAKGSGRPANPAKALVDKAELQKRLERKAAEQRTLELELAVADHPELAASFKRFRNAVNRLSMVDGHDSTEKVMTRRAGEAVTAIPDIEADIAHLQERLDIYRAAVAGNFNDYLSTIQARKDRLTATIATERAKLGKLAEAAGIDLGTI